MKINSQRIISSLFETTFWYSYLLILIWISFVAVRYESIAQYQIVAVFYLFFGCFLTATVFGMRYNQKAVVAAKLPILFCFIGLLWMLIQSFFPGFAALGFSQNAPSWYQPNLSLSVDSEKARNLFFGNLFAFSWLILTLLIVTTRSKLSQLLFVILIVGLLHALVGIMAKYSNLILVDKNAVDGHFSAARAWFVNRNHFASFVGLCLVGSTTFVFRELFKESKKQKVILLLDYLISGKVLYLIAPIIAIIAIFLSNSRAGVLGLFGSFLAAVTLLLIKDQRIRKHYKGILFFILACVGLAIFFGQEFLARLAQEGLTIGERKRQWEITWLAIKDSFWTGYGGGSYAVIFQLYRPVDEFRQVIFDQAHNEYLHIWLEQGFIGLLLWISTIIAVFASIIKFFLTRKNTLLLAFLLSVSIGLTMVLVQALVDFNIQIISIRVYLFVIIATVYIAPTVYKKRRSKATT